MNYEDSLAEWWDEDADRLNRLAAAARKVAVKVSASPQVEEQRRLSPQNQSLYDAQEQIVRKKGRWSQTDAHYQERNPFASRGILCRNCVYYEEGGTCEIVKGSIRPDAICKLWIIPDERLSIPEQRDEEERRSDDCGRQEGGKFAPKNKCQENAGDGDPSSSKSSPGGSEASKAAAEVSKASAPKPPPVSPIDVEKLLEKISQSPDGFTLDPLSAEQPADGIMVSEFANDSRRSVKIKADSFDTDDAATQLADWIANNADLIGVDPSRYIGGWKTGDDFYIDVATRFEPDQAEQALEKGRKAGQLAVFNLKTFKETWVKYEPGDDRKPPEWDAAFARARKDSTVKQVYDPDSPSLEEEDHADELSKHGKKTVRAYDVVTQEKRFDGRAAEQGGEVRHPHGREDAAGDVSGHEGLLREGRGVAGEETVPGMVRRRPRGEARSLQAGQEGLISLAKRVLGDQMPRVEMRDIGEAIAVYDHDEDVLLVSPNLPPELPVGFTTQPNPFIHEAAHRIHARANRQSYEAAASLEFSSEQRDLISHAVSSVAAINGREFVAEVLAGLMAGKMYGDGILSLAREVAGSEVIP